MSRAGKGGSPAAVNPARPSAAGAAGSGPADPGLEGEHLLAEAGRIVTGSLDEGETIRSLLRTALDLPAEGALLWLEDEREATRLVAFSSRTFSDEIATEMLHGGSPVPAIGGPVAVVIATGRPQRSEEPLATSMPGLDTGLLDRAGGDATASVLAAPLSGQRCRGVLSVLSRTQVRQHGAAHLDLVTRLASLAAAALDRARVHDEARRAVRVRDDVLGMVSHDLGVPVASITMLTDRLLRWPADEDRRVETRHYVERIRVAAARMHRMIEDLVDVQRIESTGLTIHLLREDLQELLEAATDQVSHLASARSVALVLELLPDPIAVEADRDRLVQLLDNLLSNAIRFSPEGGEVRVRGSLRGDRAVVAVSDRGPGIPADQRAHLFDRFSGPARPDRTGRTGLGLGLTIAGRIAEAHHGTLEVESEPGRGSTFRLVLPHLPRSG